MVALGILSLRELLLLLLRLGNFVWVCVHEVEGSSICVRLCRSHPKPIFFRFSSPLDVSVAPRHQTVQRLLLVARRLLFAQPGRTSCTVSTTLSVSVSQALCIPTIGQTRAIVSHIPHQPLYLASPLLFLNRSSPCLSHQRPATSSSMSLRFIHSLCGVGFLSVLALLLVHGTDAFTAISSTRAMREGTTLFVSLPTSVALKEELLALTSELAENGVFVYEQSSKERLEKAVSELEAVSTPPTQDDFLPLFRGDWKLLCTTGTNSKNKSPGGVMKPPASFGIPFLSEDPLESIRRSVRERVEVRQRIRAMSEDGETIDRVDNVVEVMPADTLSSIVSGLPDALASLSINPLGVDTAKVTLIHKANVDTTGSIPTTKLGLQSVVRKFHGKRKGIGWTVVLS